MNHEQQEKALRQAERKQGYIQETYLDSSETIGSDRHEGHGKVSMCDGSLCIEMVTGFEDFTETEPTAMLDTISMNITLDKQARLALALDLLETLKEE
jgi:hypothetical protein